MLQINVILWVRQCPFASPQHVKAPAHLFCPCAEVLSGSQGLTTPQNAPCVSTGFLSKWIKEKRSEKKHSTMLQVLVKRMLLPTNPHSGTRRKACPWKNTYISPGRWFKTLISPGCTLPEWMHWQKQPSLLYIPFRFNASCCIWSEPANTFHL